MCLYDMINLLISQQNGSLETVIDLTTIWAIEWITYILPQRLQSTKNLHNSQQPR